MFQGGIQTDFSWRSIELHRNLEEARITLETNARIKQPTGEKSRITDSAFLALDSQFPFGLIIKAAVVFGAPAHICLHRSKGGELQL